MVVRLRLQRFGRKSLPFYRIVAADSRSPRDGRHLEILGTYNPIPDADGVKDIRLKVDRVQYWLGVGAQPSQTVGRLIGAAGIVPSFPTRFKNIESVPKTDRAFSTLSMPPPATAAAATASAVGRALLLPHARSTTARLIPSFSTTPTTASAAAANVTTTTTTLAAALAELPRLTATVPSHIFDNDDIRSTLVPDVPLGRS